MTASAHASGDRAAALIAEQIESICEAMRADLALLDTLGDPDDPLVINRRFRARKAYLRELRALQRTQPENGPAAPAGGSMTTEQAARITHESASHTLTSPDNTPNAGAESPQVQPGAEVTH